MQRPVNIYFLSRDFQSDVFNSFEAHLSQKNTRDDTQKHEVESLKILVNTLLKNNVSINELNGFYYGYKIPQIGKEFDLLYISEDEILNIELKSCQISEEKIAAQLAKNTYYLSHTRKTMHLFTVVTNPMTCYQYDNGVLSKVGIDSVCNMLKVIKQPLEDDISKLFEASRFLVSPINSPDKFVNNEYFLTLQQDEYKKLIIQDIGTSGHHYYHITGKPGTGKTLLLYDIGKTLAKHGKTLIIHCGNLSFGHNRLKNRIPLLDILPAKSIGADFDFQNCKYLLVDEVHRIYTAQFDKICDYIQSSGGICIFSSDSEQVLSKLEIGRGITEKIALLTPMKSFSLSEKIRTSKELNMFIQSLFNLNLKTVLSSSYPNVDVVFACSSDEANRIKDYYVSLGYSFINFTQSNYKDSPYSRYAGGNNTHQVVGQEFDNVLMILDSSFFYINNQLSAVEHPNPDYLYLKLLYQGVTRCRMKLALIIVGNQSLFKKINSIFDYEK